MQDASGRGHRKGCTGEGEEIPASLEDCVPAQPSDHVETQRPVLQIKPHVSSSKWP